MAKETVKIRAKVTGIHAVSGIGLVMGEVYDIDRAHFGYQIMEPVGWTPTDEELGIQKQVEEETDAGVKEPASREEA
jgi:hypothetical protein